MANIQQRSPNSWFFTVSTGKQANGKYGRATKTIIVEDQKLLNTTKKLNNYLEDEYVKFRQEVQAGEYIAPEKMTFAAFVEEWKEKYAVKHLQPATLEIYLIHLKNRIIPEFGHQRIDAIKTMQVVSFIDGLSKVERQDGKEGTLSAGTIQYIYRALKNVFNRAVDWKVIKTNPVQNVKKPKVERTEMNVYTKNEVEELFLALEKELPHWRILVSLALTTGLRRGELVGLEWKHIDFDNKTLQVQQAISSTKENSLIIGEPKTKASIRKVSLPESIVAELKEYKKHCNKERLLARDLWEDGERYFMFTSGTGEPIKPHSVSQYWSRFLKRTHLRVINFHGLRHTSATLLLNQGVHAKIISARLGHSDIKVTLNTYAHVLQEADQAAADKFDSLFSKNKAN